MTPDDLPEAIEPTFEGIRLQDILQSRAQVALIDISHTFSHMSESADIAMAIDQMGKKVSKSRVRQFTSQDDDEIEKQLESALGLVGPIDISKLFPEDESSAIPAQVQEILRWLDEKPEHLQFQEGTVDLIEDKLLLGETENLTSFTEDDSPEVDVEEEQLQTAYRDAMRVLQSVIKKTGDERKSSTKILLLVFLAVLAANVHLPGIISSVITALAAVNEATTLRSTSGDGNSNI